jgi:hypothetical protein
MRGAALAVALSLGLSFSVSAWAQTEAGRQLEAGRNADLDNWAWRAAQGVVPSEAEKAVNRVIEGITKRDCPAAVAALNAGLAKGYPEVQTFAGAMFENGVCVNASWERASGLYQRALEKGQRNAAARLAAGHAAPVGGADKAATLWWAARAKTPLPGECQVTSAAAADDPDRFVAVLGTWPAERLNACVYVAAVMASIQGEADVASLASTFGLTGKVRLAWSPATGTLDISDELAAYNPGVGKLSDGTDPAAGLAGARRAFVSYLRGVADRAMNRFAKPASLPAAWRSEASFDYGAKG